MFLFLESYLSYIGFDGSLVLNIESSLLLEMLHFSGSKLIFDAIHAHIYD